MAESMPDSGSLWDKAEFPEGVEKSSWNFNIYVMYAVIHFLRGSLKSHIDSLMPNSSQCQTNFLLEDANYLQLDDCFLTNQNYIEPLQVGSVSEDVSIIQIFRQACEDTPKDVKNLEADVSFECDFNLCFKDISASEVYHESVRELESDHTSMNFQIIPSSVPGQAELVLSPGVDCSAVPGLKKLCVELKNSTFLSSELLVDELYSLLTILTSAMNVWKCQNPGFGPGEGRDGNELVYQTSLQYVGQSGPAVHIVTCVVPGETNKKHLFLTEDVSICVPCENWPSCAKKWPRKNRPSGWPSRELIEQVRKDGCHLVPKYDPQGKGLVTSAEAGEAYNNPIPKTHWRYSFSLAEKTLMNSVTDDQRMCYLIFKYLFARYVKLDSIVTTYTPKTLFLWELETVPSSQWGFPMIGDRVKILVDKLRNCVENKYCPHYFIDGCNTLQQMDEKSRRATLDNGFRMLDEEMAHGPNLETGELETTSDFPFHFMTTYKSFYPVNVWLEALSAHHQMRGKFDPPSKVPNEQNIRDFLDNSKVHPFQMPEILIHLALAEKVYGEPLPVPQSLQQEEKVTRIVQFLKESAAPAKFEEYMKELDVGLKFLHMQYKIIDEIEMFLTENPTCVYTFDESSDESGKEENEQT